MDLSNFEQSFEDKIAGRGKVYFTDGSVYDIEEIDKDLFQIEVDGTRMYTVTVRLNGTKIVSISCDCPYWDNCKHEFAALCALKEFVNKGDKRTTSFDKVNAALEKAGEKNLNSFVRAYARKNKLFRTALLLEFSDEKDILSYVKTLVRTSLKVNTDEHGYIQTGRFWEAIEGANSALEIALKEYEKGNQEIAQSIREFVKIEIEKVDVDEDDYHDKEEFLDELVIYLEDEL